jgi:hypothetical protein
MTYIFEALSEVRSLETHPLVKKARKAHKDGVWDGNVDKNGNPIVHINGKPHTVVVENLDEEIIEEETDFDELAELVENIQKVIKLFPRDNDWKKLITKHRRDIDALRRGKDLPQKVQDELMSWAMDNGEIKTDDVDELDDFIMTIIDA